MKVAKELWGIVNEDGFVLWSRGGSSTRPHLMVYETEDGAKRGIKNAWSRQILSEDEVRIKRLY